MDITETFRRSIDLVQSILKSMPETRGDDVALILEVWRRQGLKLEPNQIALIKKCYTPETVRRSRQKIQESGLFLPEKPVTQVRMDLETEYRGTMPRMDVVPQMRIKKTNEEKEQGVN